jgi:hypothetical protein
METPQPNIQVFWSFLLGDEWSDSRFVSFIPEERASASDWIGGRVGPRSDLDDMKK